MNNSQRTYHCGLIVTAFINSTVHIYITTADHNMTCFLDVWNANVGNA